MIKTAGNVIGPDKTKKRSLIMKYFTKDILIELEKVTMLTDFDNNERSTIVKEILTKHNIPWTGLGPGTNRMAVQIEGYAFKFALDSDGKIDSRREMLYCKSLYPYVIKVYECLPSGLIMVCETVDIFTLDEFHTHKEEMGEILEKISDQFLIGDVGITGKNYINWGTRADGSICILDFAYIYSVRYNLFHCSCSDDSLLRYNKTFTDLICPICGKKYTFGDIRKLITRKQQENEIGDIRRLGYNLTSAEEVVEKNPAFEPKDTNEKKKKEISEEELYLKRWKKTHKQEYKEMFKD